MKGVYIHDQPYWGERERDESERFWKQFHKIGEFERSMNQLRQWALLRGYDWHPYFGGMKNAN